MTFAIAWLRCDGAGDSCTAIGGATTSQYTLTPDDIGHRIRSRVTASNGAGNVARESARHRGGQPKPPPSNTALPVVSGVAQAGQQLTTTNGLWSSSDAPTFAIAWLRCDAAGAACAAIAGAVGAAYTLTGDDVGHTDPLARDGLQRLRRDAGELDPDRRGHRRGRGREPGRRQHGGGTPVAPAAAPSEAACRRRRTRAPRARPTRPRPPSRSRSRRSSWPRCSRRACRSRCRAARRAASPPCSRRPPRRKRGKVTMRSAGGAPARKAAAPGTRPARPRATREGDRSSAAAAGKLAAAGKAKVVVKLTAKARKALKRARAPERHAHGHGPRRGRQPGERREEGQREALISSVTSASMSFAPSARATDTRWWPSRT